MKQIQMSQVLPEELWLNIFSYLEPVDLAKAAQACYHWSQLIGCSESLWKSQCLSVGDKDTKHQILTDKGKGEKPWKEVFQDNYGYRQIRRWWLEGKFSIVKSLDDLPQRILCPMDVDTWGEILEHELKR